MGDLLAKGSVAKKLDGCLNSNSPDTAFCYIMPPARSRLSGVKNEKRASGKLPALGKHGTSHPFTNFFAIPAAFAVSYKVFGWGVPDFRLCPAKLDANEPHEAFGEIGGHVLPQTLGLLPRQSNGAFQQTTESIIHGGRSGEVPRAERH